MADRLGKMPQQPALPGSQGDPIQLSDSDTEMPDMPLVEDEPQTERDALNYLMSKLGILDSVAPPDHLGFLKANHENAQNSLAQITRALQHLRLLATELQHRSQQIRTYAHQVLRGEIEHDTRTRREREVEGPAFMQSDTYQRRNRRRLERACKAIEAGEEALGKYLRQVRCMQRLRDVLSRMVAGLARLVGLWTRIWRIYAKMNEPGGSGEPVTLRKVFMEFDKPLVWQELVRIEADVQSIGREAEEAQIALAMEAPTETEDAALAWAARMVAQPEDVVFSVLCRVRDNVQDD